MQTDFNSKIVILGELYANYKGDKNMADFFEFNDIGLPLAYFVSEKLAVITDEGSRFIEETFDLFLEALAIEDEGFEFLDEVLDKASYES